MGMYSMRFSPKELQASGYHEMIHRQNRQYVYAFHKFNQ
jgi:hypothetical protein